MAHLKLEDGEMYWELEDIRAELDALDVELARWPIEKTPQLGAWLAADTLSESQKNDLLQAFDERFEEQKRRYGYQTRDLVVLHPHVPKLDEMLKIFDKVHYHTDDEVRYIVDGSGVFGFVLPNGKQALLTIEAGEYIRIPPKTEHWFMLDEKKRIKAIRYFTSKEGWVANYTETAVRLSPEV